MYLLTLLDLSTVSEEPESESVTEEPCNSESMFFFFSHWYLFVWLKNLPCKGVSSYVMSSRNCNEHSQFKMIFEVLQTEETGNHTECR